jgi:predicted dehydrogenase
MENTLTAVVLGSGFAGQGHAQALRYCGVEVVGMVSRTQQVVEEIAQEMNISYASTDWEQALDDLKPSIVAIGTPGGVHFEPIMQALERGIHVFCDKPLAETAEKAHQLHIRAKEVGVKTAYAASYRYQPNVLYAKEMIKEGKIGQPLEIECISHFNLERLIPFGWSHRIEQGGGRLNNNFTHNLSIVEHLLEARSKYVYGSVRNDMKKAPIVSGVHDFRTRREHIPDKDELAQIEWGEGNAEWSYSVLAEFNSPHAPNPVSTLFKHSGLQPRHGDDHIVIYGETGAITMTGCYGQGNLLEHGVGGWQPVQVPERIAENLPQISDDTQRNWTVLMREFVADVRGEEYGKYQTFEDGWRYQTIIDRIRDNK